MENPSKPVVKSSMIASCKLMSERIKKDAENKEIPRPKLAIVAKAMGRVLRGLMNKPMVGKKIGAD